VCDLSHLLRAWEQADLRYLDATVKRKDNSNLLNEVERN
jgi:hypothetical protein